MDPLFQPLQIGPLTLRNRIVMSPMTRNRSPGGVPGPDVAAYYRRRAEGGVGLVVTEGVGIDHGAAIGGASLAERDIPLMYGEAALDGWRHVVAEVHAGGARIFPQLWHMGVMRENGTGPHPAVPSCRPSGIWGPVGRNSTMPEDYVQRICLPTQPMSDRDIADVISAYARAAAEAVVLGFDGIAVHGAHGYLIDTFLWSETNQRPDQWAGDITERSRFAAEVVQAIRSAVGSSFPIMFRWSQWKQQDYDAVLAGNASELEVMLRPLVDAGVTIFDASTRRFDQPAFAGSPLTLAGWTKRVTGIPTMAVGGVGLVNGLYDIARDEGAEILDNLDDVRTCLEAGEFDLIGAGRTLIADPRWPEKVARGEPTQPLTKEHLRALFDRTQELV